MKKSILLLGVIILVCFFIVENSLGESGFLEIKKVMAQEDDVLGGVGWNPQHEGVEKYLPVIKNTNWKVEKFVTGLQWPTTMDFIGNDILILEKNSGNVRLIRDGVLQEKIALTVNVDFLGERGLLGILTENSFVYLFFTESEIDDIVKNRIYKYRFDDGRLIEPELLHSFPAGASGIHNGGILAKNNDNQIFVIIGDNHNEEGIFQNNPSSTEIEDRGIVKEITGGEYYAIGIRNSFGLTVDSQTGNLWDTENGNLLYDEINLIHPKFNSGWSKIMGPDLENEKQDLPEYENFVYSDPKFSWEVTVSPTALSFIDSELFPELKNSLLVGDFNHGILYEFKLNEDRTEFIFKNEKLQDKVANRDESVDEIVLGSGFNGITDIKMGPDGLIYIISIMDGSIYRISPNIEKEENAILRCENVEVNLDLSNCNLSNRDLSNRDLSNRDFSFANLTSADLSNSKLENSKIWNADLSNSKLENSNMKNVDIFSSNFFNSNMKNVQLINAKIRQSDFNEANLFNSNFSKSNLATTVFDNSNMSKIDLRNSVINYVTFNQVNFKDANLENIYPYSSDFSNAFLDNSVRNSCLADNIVDRGLNMILKNIRQNNFPLNSIIEQIIMIIC